MKIFEIIMLVCFGAAWPFSIYYSLASRSTAGKSVVFLYIVLAGYLSGIVHKLINSRDFVIVLYILNSLMVMTDILLYYRNRAIESAKSRR